MDKFNAADAAKMDGQTRDLWITLCESQTPQDEKLCEAIDKTFDSLTQLARAIADWQKNNTN